MLYAVAMYIVGWYYARSEHRHNRLNGTSTAAVYLGTAVFITIFGFFAVPGSPNPLLFLLIPVAYHLEVHRIRKNA